MDNISDKNRSAKQQLVDAHWCVSIGRDLIEAHAKSDFGALVAFGVILAWRDRGPGWEIDGERRAAQRPPGGWPHTAGTTAPTWRRWLGRAIEIGLISEANGVRESGPPVDLLMPIKPYRTELQDEGYEMPVEQFARIPVSVLFDPKIGRTAKRVLVGVAMYRNAEGLARVAVPTIAKMATLNVRNTQNGLRRLELAGAIKSTGRIRQIRTYEIIEKRTDKVNVGDTMGERRRHQGVNVSDTRGERERHQGVNVGDTREVNVGDTLSGKAIKKTLQEKESRKNLQEKDSGAERIRPDGPAPFRRPQNELVLMRVVEGGKEGRKDARQEGKVAVEPSPEHERDRVAALLAEMELRASA